MVASRRRIGASQAADAASVPQRVIATELAARARALLCAGTRWRALFTATRRGQYAPLRADVSDRALESRPCRIPASAPMPRPLFGGRGFFMSGERAGQPTPLWRALR
jgi:hypothetical protein